MNMHQSFLWWHNYICRNSSQSGTCTDPLKKRQPGQRSYFPVPMKTSMANNIMGTLVEHKTSWKRGPQRGGWLLLVPCLFNPHSATAAADDTCRRKIWAAVLGALPNSYLFHMSFTASRWCLVWLWSLWLFVLYLKCTDTACVHWSETEYAW